MPADEPPPPPRFDTELNQPPPLPPVQVAQATAHPLFGPPALNVPPDPAPQQPAYQGVPPGYPSSPNGRLAPDHAAALRYAPSPDEYTPAPDSAPAPAGAPPYSAPRQASLPPVSPWMNPAPAVQQQSPAAVFKPGQIIAWVGDQPIQVGDVMPLVEQVMAPRLAELDPAILEEQKAAIEQQKEKLMIQALDSVIQTKLLYLDFLRTIPADKLKEALPNITKRAEEQFYEKQLPDALKKAKVETGMELDAKLREFGSSLQRQKQSFVERAMGQSVISQKVNYEPEITHQAMLDYYRAHLADYELPAKARWEKLTVRFDRFPSKQEAWAALGNMGNEVLRGAPLHVVAQRQSQGIDAAEGGYHDWTTRGSLASEAIDQAVFTLPAGRLSERLEDSEGFHIVRVIERTEAGRVPFEQAQVEIKETLRKERVKEQVTAYVEKLKQQIPVWTAFDDQAPAPGNETRPAGRS
ncbi:MAG: hypothetical protein GX575_19335 [Candidatus Anammoximicrobium sp.]|nr:hypothetical protein [Candidatus Anammoximicrobium sp.]